MDRRKRLAGRVRAEQLRTVTDTAVSTAAINSVNALLVFLTFRDTDADPGLLIGWLLVNLLYSGILLLDRRWEDAAQSTWPIRRVVIRASFLGVLWGAIPWLVLPLADPGHMLVLGVIVAGMIAGGAVRLSVLPAAAFGYLWSITMLSGAAFLIRAEPLSLIGPVLLLMLAVFLTRHIRNSTTHQIRYVVNQFELSEQNETINLLLNDFRDQSTDWVWETDRRGRICRASPRFLEAAGRAEGHLNGLMIDRLFQPEPVALARHLKRRETFREVPASIELDGEVRHWKLTGRPIYDLSRRFSGYRGVAADFTEEVLATDRLSYLAHHDLLTGLSNRVTLRDEVEAALGQRADDRVIALFLLDLDEFKAINDTMGHPVGDELLAAVGARLLARYGQEDIVARLGGDEFAILHCSQASAWSPTGFAVALLALFDEPFKLSTAELSVKTSVGVALMDAATSACSPDDLLRDADVALYRAKAEGSGFKVFEPEMNEWAARRHALRQALALAIERDELSVVFQPIVDISSNRIVCFEALSRWASAEFGEVSPAEFIAIAEESGLMKTIGEWVFARALRDASRWPKEIKLSVNLSAVQFRETALTTRFETMLAEVGFDPRRLELEVTESTFLHSNEVTRNTMLGLKAAGASIVMDDFGTGYSSLSYLRDFPFDKIKIDRTFIETSKTDAASQAIVRSVIALGHALGMTVTAEGIEEAAQIDMLRSMNCDEVQGYIFSQPLSAEAAWGMACGTGYLEPEAGNFNAGDDVRPLRRSNAA